MNAASSELLYVQSSAWDKQLRTLRCSTGCLEQIYKKTASAEKQQATQTFSEQCLLCHQARQRGGQPCGANNLSWW
eukprot:4928072-Amphidinium_carterae.1